MKKPELVSNKLRVYHMPQVPCEPFYVYVDDEFEAKKIADVFSYQHLWLFEQKIISDYSNVVGVEMLEDGEWVDYYNEDEVMDWDELEAEFFEPNTLLP